jgi:hypothetical protein
MSIVKLMKLVDRAKRNPNFDLNNWQECLVGSFLKYGMSNDKLHVGWLHSLVCEDRYRAAAKYFEITIEQAHDLFGMRDEYLALYDGSDDETKVCKEIKELAIDRVEEFIWEQSQNIR